MLRISGAGCCFSEDKGAATCSGVSASQKEVALPRRETQIRRNALLNSAQTTRHVSRRRTGTYSCGFFFLTYLPSGDPFSRRGPRSAHWQRDKNTAAKMLRSAPPSPLKGPVQRDGRKEGGVRLSPHGFVPSPSREEHSVASEDPHFSRRISDPNQKGRTPFKPFKKSFEAIWRPHFL